MISLHKRLRFIQLSRFYFRTDFRH